MKKKENTARLSQHLKKIGSRRTWEGIKTIHYENKWKKRKFKEIARNNFRSKKAINE